MRNSDRKFDIMDGSREEKCNDTSHHMSHLSKTVSSEKRRATGKDPRRGGGPGEGREYYLHSRPTPRESSSFRRCYSLKRTNQI